MDEVREGVHPAIAANAQGIILMTDSTSLWDRLVRPLTENEVTTREPGHYPEIRPRRYSAPPETVFGAVREVVEVRDNWEIVEADADEWRLAFEATTPVMKFVDDVTVSVDEKDGVSVVHVHSASRVGQGDMGKNASRVRELFEQLDTAI